MSRVFDRQDVAQRYDSARALPGEGCLYWMQTLRDLLPPVMVTSVLDLGAGTGRFTESLLKAFQCTVVAVDPSEAMLEQGKSHGWAEVRWLVGSAESIPLEDRSVDLVWMSQVFHHLHSVPAAFGEIRRVLKPGGYLAIRNATRENNLEIGWGHCFPEAQAIDDARMPSQQDVVGRVGALGFESTTVKTVHRVFASSYAEYYDKISQRALSTLLAISDEAFEAGLARLKLWIDGKPKDKPVREPMDLFIFRASQ